MLLPHDMVSLIIYSLSVALSEHRVLCCEIVALALRILLAAVKAHFLLHFPAAEGKDWRIPQS
jgi:hypothetical protein